MKNCYKCKHYLSCDDPQKSHAHVCASFKRLKLERDLEDVQILVPRSKGSSEYVPYDPERDEGQNDIWNMVNTSMSSKDVVVDLTFDEHDFPLAKNFFEFCKPNFLNMEPYVVQMAIAIILYAEYCPRCSDVQWLFHDRKVDDKLSKFARKVALYEHGVCPHCGMTRSKAHRKGLQKVYNELAASVGQRAGKSALVAMLAAYQMHRFLKLGNPNQVFRLMRSNILHGTFVALTFKQAKENLWDPFAGALATSPWFQGYHDMVLHHSNRRGDELVKFGEASLVYKHRHLMIYPSGPDKRTLRGRTRNLACLTGDNLVSTSRGLVRMDSEAQLVGSKTNRGNQNAPVVGWIYSGKKPVWQLTLKNGMSVKATADHPFQVLPKGGSELVWKQLCELLPTDYATVSVGGTFPRRLDLSFEHERRTPNKSHTIIDYMLSARDGFTLQDLAEVSGKTYRGVTATISMLKRAAPAALARTRAGRTAPFVYTVRNRKQLKAAYARMDDGKINRLKNAVRFPSRMTVELAYLIGYLIADGNYSQWGTEISFTSTSPSKINHFYECFVSVFGIHPRVSTWQYEEGKDAHSVVFALSELKAFLEYIGLTPAWSETKTMPWSILEAPEECAAACVSAMLSCDGSVADRLTYSSKSVELVRQLQLLLLRLGYHTRVRVDVRTPFLVMGSADASRFLSQHYTGLEKREGRKTTRTSRTGLASFNRYRIPGLQFYAKGGRLRSAYTRSELNADILDVLPTHLIDRGFAFTRVVSKKYVGVEDVFDISVGADHHSFTAGGVLVHNCIDEAGWFDADASSNKIKVNGWETYKSLGNSLRTIRSKSLPLLRKGFDNVPTGMFLNVSSPSSERDMIMSLVRLARDSDTMLGVHLPTWEFNPEVTRESLRDDYRKDPIGAERDFGARPPLSSSPFFASKEVLHKAFTGKSNDVELSYSTVKSKVSGERRRYAKFLKLKPVRTPTVLALDAGFNKNSFALVVAGWKNEVPTVFRMVEVMPLPGIPLNYRKLYDHIITPLIHTCNVQLVAADRWNSLKIMSDIEEDHEIATTIYSLRYDDCLLFRDYLYDGQFVFPALPSGVAVDDCTHYSIEEYPLPFKNRTVEHLVLQLLTVQDTGQAVVKGDRLTDDILRASMLAHSCLLDENYADLWLAPEADVRPQFNVQQAFVMRGLSGGVSRGVAGAGASRPALGMVKRGSQR